MLSKKKGFVMKRNLTRAEAMREMKYKGDLRPNIKGKKKSSENAGDTLVAKTEHGKEINIKRNQVFGGDSSLMQVTAKEMYVDSSRAVDITQSDMKKSMQQKSKEAKKFAKERRFLDTVEFEKTGGMKGSIMTAKSLITRRMYPEAINYLDAAIYHGCRELGEWEEFETPDILAARILRGKCYLNMGRYRFSQAEAEKVLESDPNNSTAMYILGESLYLQCKFEYGLMVFHRGFRLRTELYGEEFQKGVAKATNAIRLSLVALEESSFISNEEFYHLVQLVENKSEEVNDEQKLEEGKEEIESKPSTQQNLDSNAVDLTLEANSSNKKQSSSKSKSKKRNEAADFYTDDQLLSSVQKQKKGKRGKAARPSLVGNTLVEIEKELKAIEEDARKEKRNNRSKMNSTSSEDDSDSEATGVIVHGLYHLGAIKKLKKNVPKKQKRRFQLTARTALSVPTKADSNSPTFSEKDLLHKTKRKSKQGFSRREKMSEDEIFLHNLIDTFSPKPIDPSMIGIGNYQQESLGVSTSTQIGTSSKSQQILNGKIAELSREMLSFVQERKGFWEAQTNPSNHAN